MKTVAILFGPLLIIAGVALALYGTAGPADNDIRAMALFRILGMVYGIYLVALSVVWSRRQQRNDKR